VKQNASLLVGLSVMCWMLVMLAVPQTRAQPSSVTFTVNSTLDQVDDSVGDGVCHTTANTCTLRAAVMEANLTSGPDTTINLPAGIYALTIPAQQGNFDDSGDLNLRAPANGDPPISIVGVGPAETIVDANQLDRAFRIDLGRTAILWGLTIRNGSAKDGSGGGLLNLGGLTLGESMIRDNTTVGSGGGIYSAGALVVIASTISGNTANESGGGMAITAAGSLIAQNSTIDGNKSGNSGGGIYNGGTANVYNTTIVFNKSDLSDIGIPEGGGIFNQSGSPGIPPGIFNLRNTLLAGNTRAFGVLDDCFGVVSSYGRNLFLTVDSRMCRITNVDGGSWIYLNSLDTLGPLQNNGGPTWTRALLPDSNAIDATAPGLSNACLDESSLPLATDQRGWARVGGAHCDIGAFEYYPPLFLPLLQQ
jgi:CSLREA domain-containing protein